MITQNFEAMQVVFQMPVHPSMSALFVLGQVCIHSPPRAPGLSDPETYYEKFRAHGEIAFITICLQNGILLRVGRRVATMFFVHYARLREREGGRVAHGRVAFSTESLSHMV